jgi:hypothetical protein
MQDVLFNFSDGTIFKNGDLNIGVCDDQNKTILLVCEKGSFKEFPSTCVGAGSYLETEDTDALIREVRAQFSADGMTVKSVSIDSDNKLRVDASY